MSRMLENSMVVGPEYEESTERPEAEGERDYTLVDELKNITLLRTQISRIEGLVEKLENTTYGRRQA